ncbi:hypothetical protein [Zooshikella ganghwensis]|uniref:hypothetical protein n=1 Tax=Zooshikella ganghwensis TaxID=202772 RepID=UPI00040D1442|nr:hypothetical protein [Zooshikella ganghwensis]
MAFLIITLISLLTLAAAILACVLLPQCFWRLNDELREGLLLEQVLPVSFPVLGAISTLCVFLMFLLSKPVFIAAVIMVTVAAGLFAAGFYMIPQLVQSYKNRAKQIYGAEQLVQQWQFACVGTAAGAALLSTIVIVLL